MSEEEQDKIEDYDRWQPLKYHYLQSMAWRSPAPWKALACGRGSGKTLLARRYIVRRLAEQKPWNDPIYCYAMPTNKQVKRVAWGKLKMLVQLMPGWVRKISESDQVIETVFGSKLYVVGLDVPARVEGVQWDGVIIDESCDIKPKTFDLSIAPALTHRNGWCWRIGVPKRAGCGAREFKEWFDKGKPPGTPGASHESYTWPSSDILTPEKLKRAQDNLDPRDFNEQFGAAWETTGGLVFYSYSDTASVSTEAVYRPDLPILVGSDFNVNPMAWVLGQSRDVTLSPMPPERISELTIFDELFIRNTNTPRTLDELHRRYGGHKGGWMFFGDASARNRHSSASMSDYTHIRNDTRFPGARIYYLKSNPLVVDRFSATNSGLCTASGERRVTIHPKCKNLRTDLLNRAYEEGTRTPDDYLDVGHITDAFGYLCYKLFPPRAVNAGFAPEVGLQA